MERSCGTCSIMKLTAKQIERLVKQGEVVHVECKDASGGLPDSLWESYSSFEGNKQTGHWEVVK